MNFTNLYYPTAESANADADFINKVLVDDLITVDMTIVPYGSPTVDIFLLDQQLYTGQITEELNLLKTISVTDWSIGQLRIKLSSADDTGLELKSCKIQQVEIVKYPLSEEIIVDTGGNKAINTKAFGNSELVINISNPICLWILEKGDDSLDKSKSGTSIKKINDYCEEIEKYLTKLL
jgi:hypothetical protein